MAKVDQLRCPRCGTCYEGDATVFKVQTMVCENCGATTTLLEENPNGLLPPLPRLLALAGTILLCLVAIRSSIFVIFALVALVYLAIDILQGHKKQRSDHIVLWDRLRNAYTELDTSNKRLTADLDHTKQSLTELDTSNKRLTTDLNQTKQSFAELDTSNKRLTTDLNQTKQSLTELDTSNKRVTADLDHTKQSLTELDTSNKRLTADLNQTKQSLVESLNRYEQIAPERRDKLAEEIVTQQKTLCLLGDLATMTVEKDKLQAIIKELKARIVSFEEEELLQSFGFHKPLYDCSDSAAYRQLLEKIREKQKEMVQEHKALHIETTFNDKAGGKKIAKNLEKLILRAFNDECDVAIDQVTFSNLDAITTRITKGYQQLNDLCQVVGISISQAYLNTKMEELDVCYEYQRKLKDEREEQRKIREQMREQARLVKEIEDARKKIEKEEAHFNQVIAELQARMEAAAASEKAQYEAKLREYQEQLAAVQKDKEEVAFREQSTRAGYVYIISNIGTLGENAYKIGVTRRLDPQERIDELGDSSVPFDFDVHAMIFSEDAPLLEAALHEHFANRAINKVNRRKEFFRVHLDEIEEVVRTHHNKLVEFTKIAKAEDYRLTLAKERAIAPDVTPQGTA